MKEKRGGLRTPGPGKKLGATKKRPPGYKGASLQNLPEELRMAFKTYCHDRGRTMSWSIVDMVKNYLPEEYLPPGTE